MKDLLVSQTKRASIRQAADSVDSDALLTIPRNRSKDSLTHLAIGTNSDVVRGSLVRLDNQTVEMQSKLEAVTLSRDAVAGIVWLHDDAPMPDPSDDRVQVVLGDTTTLSLSHPRLISDTLVGTHPVLGNCSIPKDELQTMLMGGAENDFHQYDFVRWKAIAAKQPQFATGIADGHRMKSPLVGRTVDFEADLLETGQPLNLVEYRGKVVVLDFWATWCAPCIRNMPKLIECMNQFSTDEVQLIAVNQGEHPTTVSTLLKAKKWNLLVGIDLQSTATRSLAIQALPQSVVLDQDGEVTAVFVGASSRLHEELETEVKALLGEDN